LAGVAAFESRASASAARHPRRFAGRLAADAYRGYAVAGQNMTFGPAAAVAAKV